MGRGIRGGGFGGFGTNPFDTGRWGGLGRYTSGDASAEDLDAYLVAVRWQNGQATDEEYLASLKGLITKSPAGSKERAGRQDKYDDAVYTIERNKIVRSFNAAVGTDAQLLAMGRLIVHDRRRLGNMNRDNEQYRELQARVEDSERQLRDIRYSEQVTRYNENKLSTDDLIAYVRRGLAESRGRPDQPEWEKRLADFTERKADEQQTTLYAAYQEDPTKADDVLSFLDQRIAGMDPDSPKAKQLLADKAQIQKQVKERLQAAEDAQTYADHQEGRITDSAYLTHLREKIGQADVGTRERIDAEHALVSETFRLRSDQLEFEAQEDMTKVPGLISHYRAYLLTMDPGSDQFRAISAKIDGLRSRATQQLGYGGGQGLGGYNGPGPGIAAPGSGAFISAMDGSSYWRLNCAAASGAMMAYIMSGGKVRVAGADIRAFTGDTFGGLGLDQVGSVLQRRYGFGYETHNGFDFDAFKQELTGRAAVVSGLLDNLPGSYNAAPGISGGHQVVVLKYDAKRNAFLVMNPGRRRSTGEWWPAEVMRRFAWGGNTVNGERRFGSVAFQQRGTHPPTNLPKFTGYSYGPVTNEGKAWYRSGPGKAQPKLFADKDIPGATATGDATKDIAVVDQAPSAAKSSGYDPKQDVGGIVGQGAEVADAILTKLGASTTPGMRRAVVAWVLNATGDTIEGNNPLNLLDADGKPKLFDTLEEGIAAAAAAVQERPAVATAAKTGDPGQFLNAIAQSGWFGVDKASPNLIATYNQLPGNQKLVAGGSLTDMPPSLSHVAQMNMEVGKLLNVDPLDPTQQGWFDLNLAAMKDAHDRGASTWNFTDLSGDIVPLPMMPTMYVDMLRVNQSQAHYRQFAPGNTPADYDKAGKDYQSIGAEIAMTGARMAYDEFEQDMEVYDRLEQRALAAGDFAGAMNIALERKASAARLLGQPADQPLDMEKGANLGSLTEEQRTRVANIIDNQIEPRGLNADDPEGFNPGGNRLLGLAMSGYLRPELDRNGRVVTANVEPRYAYVTQDEKGVYQLVTIEDKQADFDLIPQEDANGNPVEPVPAYQRNMTEVSTANADGTSNIFWVTAKAGAVTLAVMETYGYRDAKTGALVPTGQPQQPSGMGGINTPRPVPSVLERADKMVRWLDSAQVPALTMTFREGDRIVTGYSIDGGKSWLRMERNAATSPPRLVLNVGLDQDPRVQIANGGVTVDGLELSKYLEVHPGESAAGYLHWYGTDPDDDPTNRSQGAPNRWMVIREADELGRVDMTLSPHEEYLTHPQWGARVAAPGDMRPGDTFAQRGDPFDTTSADSPYLTMKPPDAKIEKYQGQTSGSWGITEAGRRGVEGGVLAGLRRESQGIAWAAPQVSATANAYAGVEKARTAAAAATADRIRAQASIEQKRIEAMRIARERRVTVPTVRPTTTTPLYAPPTVTIAPPAPRPIVPTRTGGAGGARPT